MPCKIIRYNTDSKNSYLDILLITVNKYLKLAMNNKPWDNYGYGVEYLFY